MDAGPGPDPADVAGRLGGHTMHSAGLAGDVAAGEVTAALVTVAAATLRGWLPESTPGPCSATSASSPPPAAPA
jgi:hypothetical protein